MECKTFSAVWFTDIDNTLLPLSGRRNLDKLKKFLDELESHCILVVPVTFRTYDELMNLAEAIGYKFKVFAVEGGCLTALSSNIIYPYRGRDGYIEMELCSNVGRVKRAVDYCCRDSCRDTLLRLSDLDATEIGRILGISEDEAVYAVNRRYTEILYLKDPDRAGGAIRCLEDMGLKPIVSRKIMHITEVGKEVAVKKVLELIGYKVRGIVVASGDSSIMDKGFLELSDVPVIVSRNAYEWYRRYPYVSIYGDIPISLIEYLSRLLLLKPLE